MKNRTTQLQANRSLSLSGEGEGRGDKTQLAIDRLIRRNSFLFTVILFLFVTFFFHQFSFAQKLTASSKQRVAVGEQFQIAYSLNTNGGNFKVPAMDGFDVYSGPNQSTSIQMINGSVSQSVSFSFIVAARKEGKYTIGPASVVVDGKRIESNSLTIEVVKGNASGGAQQQQQRQQQQQGQSRYGDGDESSIENNLFARTVVSRSKVYQGEQITVTHKIYTRLNLRGFQDIAFPSYNGFWSQEVPHQGQISLSQENIDGVAYNVAEIRKVLVFPQRSGTLEIEPVKIECVVRQRASRAPQSIFDQFFGGGVEDVVYSVKSNAVKVEVLPLPEAGKPENFSGAVGTFSSKSSISKEKVKENDAVTLSITISGKGNLKLIEPAKLQLPEEIESYDPKVSDNIHITAAGVSGSKTFEYLLIPRHEGEYKLGDISFSYFDTDKKTYVTLPSPEFSIQVLKGDGDPASVHSGVPMAKEEVKMLGKDIRYIKTDHVKFEKVGKYFFGSGLFYAGIITPVMALALLLLVRKKRDETMADVVKLKSKRANKIARKHLTEAEKHLKANDATKFYDAIFRALYGYIGDKFNLPVSELSKERIVEILKQKNVSDVAIKNLIDTIDQCEFARYAAAMAGGDLQSVYNKSEDVIMDVEQQIKTV